jgi:TatD DNase family protein
VRTAKAGSRVDTHCHLDLFPDVAAAIRQTEAAGVLTVAVTNAPSVYSRLVEIVGTSDVIRVALGLHPELAHERQGELPLFHQLIERTKYVGEVGLDYTTPDEAQRRVQRMVLDAIVESCSRTGRKLVTVHSRRAADDVVDAFGVFRGTYILHWYSGSLRALRRALANGAYVSVNPAMVRSESSMKLMSHVPQERILTETDGPFVAIGGRPAQPSDVDHAIQGLARLWEVNDDVAQDVVYNNFSRMLRANEEPAD